MKTCDQCNMGLWSTDKGVCPTCKPEENRLAYGLAPLAQMIAKEPTRETRRVLIETKVETTQEPTVTTIEGSTLSDVVKFYILKVYEETGKNKAKTSRKLGITNRTLYNHLDRYGVM